MRNLNAHEISRTFPPSAATPVHELAFLRASVMDHNAVVSWRGLKEDFGIPESRTTIWRWMDAGKFPRIINPKKSRNTHPLWWRHEIVAYLKSLLP
jgi:predicted DNA-binding transcriptional regulator AlpA